MVYYPRGLGHRLEVIGPNPASLLCASISFEAGSYSVIAGALPACLHMRLAEAPSLGPRLDVLFSEAKQPGPGVEIFLDRLCDALIIQVIRHQFTSGHMPLGMLAGLADRRLAPVLTAIHERPQELWQLESLALLACMSRTRFTEHFRDVVGTPPGTYLTQWRIRLAQTLLKSEIQIKEVSQCVGDNSAAAFTRAFAGWVGAFPRKWLSTQMNWSQYATSAIPPILATANTTCPTGVLICTVCSSAPIASAWPSEATLKPGPDTTSRTAWHHSYGLLHT